MPLLGLSAGAAKLVKWGIRAAETAVPAVVAWLSDELTPEVEVSDDLVWGRFVQRWTRATPSGTVEDYAQFKLDFVNVTGDELDLTWTTTDWNVLRDAFATFRAAILTHVAPSQSWSDVKGYLMSFNPALDVAKPFADTGPPAYQTVGVSSGTGTSGIPYQIAPTITLRTGWAKHWGRIYLPTPGTGALDTNGRLTSTYRSAVGTALKTLLSTAHDAGLYPVVPVGQVEKQPLHALLGVTAVVVDDVPDVQRRRRPKMAAQRTVA